MKRRPLPIAIFALLMLRVTECLSQSGQKAKLDSVAEFERVYAARILKLVKITERAEAVGAGPAGVAELDRELEGAFVEGQIVSATITGLDAGFRASEDSEYLLSDNAVYDIEHPATSDTEPHIAIITAVVDSFAVEQ